MPRGKRGAGQRRAAGRPGPYSPGGEGPATRTVTSTQAAAPASTDTVAPQFPDEMAQLQRMLMQGIAQGFALGVQALRDSESGHASTGATAVHTTGPPAIQPPVIQPPVIQPPAPLQVDAEVVFPSLPGRQDTSTLANPIDSFVPPKLRDWIWNKEFVDLLNLIQEEPAPARFSIDSTDSSPSITMIAPSKRVVTSILQWVKAFRRYTAVYMQKWPQEVQGLLKHAEVVQGLHEEGCDWRTYDTRFRRLHAYGREVYGHINIDLYATATRPPRARQPTAEWQGPDRKGGKMPRGFCWEFHSGRHCEGCSFSHQCYICGSAHPATKCGKRDNFRQQGEHNNFRRQGVNRFRPANADQPRRQGPTTA